MSENMVYFLIIISFAIASLLAGENRYIVVLAFIFGLPAVVLLGFLIAHPIGFLLYGLVYLIIGIVVFKCM